MRLLPLLALAACSSPEPAPLTVAAASIDGPVEAADRWWDDCLPCKVTDHRETGAVVLNGWRTYCSTDDPERWCVTWTVADPEEPAYVVIGITLDEEGDVQPGLSARAPLAEWPGGSLPFYAAAGVEPSGGRAVYLRWRPKKALVGAKVYVQLHAATGKSDVLAVTVGGSDD